MSQIKPLCLLALLSAPILGFSQDLVIPVSQRVSSLVILPTGQFAAAHGDAATRFGKDGSIEKTFGRPGFDGLLALDNDLTTLVSDSRTISRFTLGGALASFYNLRTDDLLLQPDGKLVLWDGRTISRQLPNGAPDTTFSSSLLIESIGIGSGRLALQENGKILAGATLTNLLVRFAADGQPDPSFNAPRLQSGAVNSIAVQSDGKIIAGGRFDTAAPDARQALVRLNPDGSLDTDFKPVLEPFPAVFSLALQANGKILISGLFNSVDGHAVTNIARLNSDGTLDESFQPGTFERPPISFLTPIPLALAEDGAVLVGYSTNIVRISNPEQATQSFTHEGGALTWLRGGSSPEIYHARFQSSTDGVAWTDLGSGSRIPGGWRLADVTVPVSSRFRARGYVTGGSYFVDFVPGAPAILAHPLATTNNVGEVSKLQVFAKGAEPLAFRWFKDGAAIDGATSSELILSNVTGAATGHYSVVVSNAEGASASRTAPLKVNDPVILVQPTSVWLNGGETLNLSVTAAGTGLSYQWKQNGEPIPGATSSSLVIQNVNGSHTGNYQVTLTGTYGALQSANVLVRVNMALPDSWNPVYLASTEWFALQSVAALNNEIFMAGLFRTIADPVRRHLVKFEANGALDAGFAPEPSGGNPEGVSTVAVAPNGQLLVGGSFQSIAGQTQPYLARLAPDGGMDETFKPEIGGLMGGLYTQVGAIELQPDGRILIAGTFSTVNGQPRPGVARLLPDGTLDGSFAPKTNDVPRLSWGLLLQPDGKVVVYGWDIRRLLPDGAGDAGFAGRVPQAGPSTILMLPDGKLLMDGLALLNTDGSIDPTFVRPTTQGYLQGLQANGKIILRREATHLHEAFLRLNLDGSWDPSFSPVMDAFGTVKAMRADGSLIVAGWFKNIAGANLPGLARLQNNEPATQSLTFHDATATWLRGGSSPEVTRTTFEFSEDGQTWTHLGAGARVEGGWQLDGLQLASRGVLRAQGFSKGSVYQSTIELPVRPKIETLTFNRQSGQLVLTVSSPGASSAVLEMSTDLAQWTSLQTNVLTTPTLQFSLPEMTLPRAYYRLRQLAE